MRQVHRPLIQGLPIQPRPIALALGCARPRPPPGEALEVPLRASVGDAHVQLRTDAHGELMGCADIAIHGLTTFVVPQAHLAVTCDREGDGVVCDRSTVP